MFTVGKLGPVSSLVFSPDGQIIFVAQGWTNGQGRLSAISRKTRGVIASCDSKQGKVRGVDFSPDGTAVVICGGEVETSPVGDGWVRVLDATDCKELLSFGFKGEAYQSVAFSSDARCFAAGGATEKGGMLRMWNFRRGEEGWPAQFTTHAIESVRFAANDRALATGNMGGYVTLRRISDGKPLWSVKPHSRLAARVLAVSCSVRGEALAAAVGSWNRGNRWGALELVDQKSGRPLGSLVANLANPVTATAFSKDGTLLAAVTSDGITMLWVVGGSPSAD
jgi:WD40 repeat protein